MMLARHRRPVMSINAVPKISVIHPTARVIQGPNNAPPAWLTACGNFADTAEEPFEIEYVLVVHHTRWSFLTRYLLCLPKTFSKVTLVCNWGRDCVVDQFNAGAMASDPRTKIITGIMDDLRAPQSWDTQMTAAFPDLAGYYSLHCSSGSPRDHELTSIGAITRAVYNRVGYIAHPDYISVCSDVDWRAMVQRLGWFVDASHIKFEHLHPAFGKAKWDEVYGMENSEEAVSVGATVLGRRREEGFPLPADEAR